MRIVAGPVGSGLPTDSTTISCSFFGVMAAFCVTPPALIVTSWKLMSAAFSVISEVAFSTRIEMVSSPSNVALSRSGVKVSL